MSYNKEDVFNFIENNDVKFIRLQFTDIFGRIKNVAVTQQQLAKAFDDGFAFDASAVPGFTGREAIDLYLYPNPETISIIPWRPQHGKVARLICDVRKADGTEFEGDPRHILKKVVGKAGKMGYTFNVGPKCEFFLFHTAADGSPTTKTHDTAGYFDLAPIDLGENVRREICMVLEDMGFEIEASYHESAVGQHEVDFRYSDVVTAADNTVTFKMVIKIIAQRNGLHATFMPKPIAATCGSAMHINMSLARDGKNLFNAGRGDVSEEAKAFAAGILAHIKGITAVSNPIVNSYKRLGHGFDAPKYIVWSHLNGSPLLRVPAPKGETTRLELRSPDPTCNPYLTFALVLAAGLDGLEKKMTLPPPVDFDISSLTPEQEKEYGFEKLPSNLLFALEEMKKDDLVRTVLGEHILSRYLAAKEREWKIYDSCVHQWEIENYLTAY